MRCGRPLGGGPPEEAASRWLAVRALGDRRPAHTTKGTEHGSVEEAAPDAGHDSCRERHDGGRRGSDRIGGRRRTPEGRRSRRNQQGKARRSQGKKQRKKRRNERKKQKKEAQKKNKKKRKERAKKKKKRSKKSRDRPKARTKRVEKQTGKRIVR